MVRFSRAVLCVLIITAILSSSTLASAELFQDITHKLFRGIANILTGWIEIPKNMYNDSVEVSPWYGWFTGLLKGIGFTVVRTGAGVWDTITFLFPIPSDYEPVWEPEFVF